MGQKVSCTSCENDAVNGYLESPAPGTTGLNKSAGPGAAGGASMNIAKLCFAASSGDAAAVQRVLQGGVDVNAVDYDHRSALHIAASDGHLEVVDFLISAKANVNAKDRWGHTALDEAMSAGYADVRDRLIGANATSGVDLSIDQEATPGPVLSSKASPLVPVREADAVHAQMEAATGLCCAAAAGALAVIQELHQSNADLNSADYDGRTALHVASAHGHLELVKWLMAHKADVNAKDSFGLTPLGEATKLRHTDLANLLTDGGAESSEMMEVRLQAETGAWAIPLSEVKIGDVLSKTLKSVIYRATWRGTQVVCKTTGTLKMTKSGTALDMAKGGGVKGLAAAAKLAASAAEEDAAAAEEELIHEIRLLSTIRHPDLVMFLGACIDHAPPLVISEYMEGGDLERFYIAQSKKTGYPYRPPGATLLKWASAVARALAFLHGCSRPIIHRDLKPLNLLLNKVQEVKVTDFGISKLLAPAAPTGELGSIHAPAVMSGGVGTWRYMAPEVVRYEQYTDRVDIYSFALILWFMCTGRQPFVEQFGNDAEVVLKEYLKGREPRPDPGAMKCPPALRQLTQDCWRTEPKTRPSAQDCTQRLANLVVAKGDERFFKFSLTSMSHLLKHKTKDKERTAHA